MSTNTHFSYKRESYIGSILLFAMPSWKVRGLLQTAEAKASMNASCWKSSWLWNCTRNMELLWLTGEYLVIEIFLTLQGYKHIWCCVIYKIKWCDFNINQVQHIFLPFVCERITFYKTCKLKERKKVYSQNILLNNSIQSIFWMKLFVDSWRRRPESAKHATNQDNTANWSPAEAGTCWFCRHSFPFSDTCESWRCEK